MKNRTKDEKQDLKKQVKDWMKKEGINLNEFTQKNVDQYVDIVVEMERKMKNPETKKAFQDVFTKNPTYITDPNSGERKLDTLSSIRVQIQNSVRTLALFSNYEPEQIQAHLEKLKDKMAESPDNKIRKDFAANASPKQNHSLFGRLKSAISTTVSQDLKIAREFLTQKIADFTAKISGPGKK